MSDSKDKLGDEFKAGAESPKDPLADWPGKTVHEDGRSERRVIANGQPFMVTRDKDGGFTGFGYV
jgi:hypothetical protein